MCFRSNMHIILDIIILFNTIYTVLSKDYIIVCQFINLDLLPYDCEYIKGAVHIEGEFDNIKGKEVMASYFRYICKFKIFI